MNRRDLFRGAGALALTAAMPPVVNSQSAVWAEPAAQADIIADMCAPIMLWVGNDGRVWTTDGYSAAPTRL